MDKFIFILVNISTYWGKHLRLLSLINNNRVIMKWKKNYHEKH